MKTVLFMGYQGGGKTTTIELVTRALTRAGLTVGTLKHIHEPDFTIDTPGKDTWRHARAGAEVIVALSAKEMTLILRRDTSKIPFGTLLSLFKKEHVDYLLVEGFFGKLGRRRRIIRVICADDEEQAQELLEGSGGKVVCITGKAAEVTKGDAYHGVPLIRLPGDMPALLKLMEIGGRRSPSGSALKRSLTWSR